MRLGSRLKRSLGSCKHLDFLKNRKPSVPPKYPHPVLWRPRRYNKDADTMAAAVFLAETDLLWWHDDAVAAFFVQCASGLDTALILRFDGTYDQHRAAGGWVLYHRSADNSQFVLANGGVYLREAASVDDGEKSGLVSGLLGVGRVQAMAWAEQSAYSCA